MWLLRKKAVKLVESIKNRWTSERDGHVTGKTAMSLVLNGFGGVIMLSN